MPWSLSPFPSSLESPVPTTDQLTGIAPNGQASHHSKVPILRKRILTPRLTELLGIETRALPGGPNEAAPFHELTHVGYKFKAGMVMLSNWPGRVLVLGLAVGEAGELLHTLADLQPR
jgi:hypothetical protein